MSQLRCRPVDWTPTSGQEDGFAPPSLLSPRRLLPRSSTRTSSSLTLDRPLLTLSSPSQLPTPNFQAVQNVGCVPRIRPPPVRAEAGHLGALHAAQGPRRGPLLHGLPWRASRHRRHSGGDQLVPRWPTSLGHPKVGGTPNDSGLAQELTGS